jgi:transposase
MSEPTGCAAACCRSTNPTPSTPAGVHCDRCDTLVGLPGLHVVAVERLRDRRGEALAVLVESAPAVVGCPVCGVVARSHGRRMVELVDMACFGRPVTLRWRKRTLTCPDAGCPVGTFTEQDPHVAPARALLTTRAAQWAVGQVRREHASIHGLAPQLRTTWHTVWRSVQPLLERAAADESRFAGVAVLGVDEHVWHHVCTKPVDQGERGPKELTGMVDLTPDQHGRVRARLLDLVPGRSGGVYKDWLKARGDTFRAAVKVATLDPFHGYKNAIEDQLDDQLDDATAVLDAFHVVALAGKAVDQCRRQVQQAIHGHRGRKGDPLYGIRNLLHAGPEHLTERQLARIRTALAADERHDEVTLAWHCFQQVRAVYHAPTPAAGKALAERITASFPSCPVPEIARLGKTLRRWKAAFLAYVDTGGASNGGTEAINGLIELHRRIARGFRNRDNYRLRMLLIAGGLNL